MTITNATTESLAAGPGPDVDVVIVGAGPVGLAAALLCERARLTGVVFERHAHRPEHPKARGIRLRASELARLWGFDEALRAVSMPGETHRFIYTTTLSGEEIARTAPAQGVTSSWASTTQYRVAQDHLEELLERQLAVESNRVKLRVGQKVVGIEQDDTGVTVTLEDEGGILTTTRARYVIAADGVASTVRKLMGLTLGDRRPAPYWHSVFWHSNLADLTRHRPAIMYYTQTGVDSLVGIAPAGGVDRWVLIMQRPASDDRPAPLSDDEARAVIRTAVDRADLEIDVVSTATFRISADVVERYRVGRVFLAGDAAHSLPPTGGFGINTGFADIHNLVWKLVSVLGGEAPASLLDSYETERREVALSNAAWSTVNSKRFIALKKALAADDRPEIVRLVAEQSAHVDPVELDLGFSYAPTADNARPSYERLTLGARAPHAPVESPDGVISTLDVFDRGFTIIVAPQSQWLKSVREQTEMSHLVVLVLGEPRLAGADELLRQRYDLGRRGVVLVRPDGHVAWLDRGDQDASPARLSRILRSVLATGLAVELSRS